MTISDLEPGSPEQLMEERIERLVTEMDNLVALSRDPEQRPLIVMQWRGIDQILSRAQLVLSAAVAEKPNNFRIIGRAS